MNTGTDANSGIDLNANVGISTALVNITSTGCGSLFIGANVTTSGNQAYGTNVTLGIGNIDLHVHRRPEHQLRRHDHGSGEPPM